jgi:pimeloyl-ACP methyl ester carboxylesterase
VTLADTVVLLPGTGSDEVFVTEVFAGPVAAAGLRLIAVRPSPGPRLAEDFLAALDKAAAEGPIVAGGVSLGAHLAVEWALASPDRCAGLVLALPGWHGPVDAAPAAAAARASAEQVRTLGVDEALARAVDGVPDWLAAELTRAWRRAGTNLADALLVAARRPAPELDQLARIGVPAGVAGCVDDPVHPIGVAEAWTEALPTARLRTIDFARFGAGRHHLGQAALAAYLEARSTLP